MATRNKGFGYANLAMRGRIIDGQLAPALDLAPDLISIQGAGNDLLHLNIDINALVEAIDAAATQAAGAEVVLCTHGVAASGRSARSEDGGAIFNELLREGGRRALLRTRRGQP